MGKRSASGNGTVRKKEVFRKGKKYVYWEARYTLGTDPGTGKQIQKSITGKTLKEVSQKLKEITLQIDKKVFVEPSQMCVGQWMTVWLNDYSNNLKPSTKRVYAAFIRSRIVPGIGSVSLKNIHPAVIQHFINDLSKPNGANLSPKTIKDIHGIIHKALAQAVVLGYIPNNPADNCVLPKIVKQKIAPLDDEDMPRFMEEISANPFKMIYITVLFTGLRRGEVCGLTWDNVDFKRNLIYVTQQLQKLPSDETYLFVPPKSSSARTVPIPESLSKLLKAHRAAQAHMALKAGPAWHNHLNLVFTNSLGRYVSPNSLSRDFKRVVCKIGRPELRFHDLRHTYATLALRAGDNVKTVQDNLGHATAAFTLDVYGHVTNDMKKESAQRIEQFAANTLSS